MYNLHGGQFGRSYQHYKYIYLLAQQFHFGEFTLQIYLCKCKESMFMVVCCSVVWMGKDLKQRKCPSGGIFLRGDDLLA